MEVPPTEDRDEVLETEEDRAPDACIWRFVWS